jgi:hypothetical protein
MDFQRGMHISSRKMWIAKYDDDKLEEIKRVNAWAS